MIKDQKSISDLPLHYESSRTFRPSGTGVLRLKFCISVFTGLPITLIGQLLLDLHLESRSETPDPKLRMEKQRADFI